MNLALGALAADRAQVGGSEPRQLAPPGRTSGAACNHLEGHGIFGFEACDGALELGEVRPLLQASGIPPAARR
eukprot:1141536-Alexandrium_andersonii.AAC.1